MIDNQRTLLSAFKGVVIIQVFAFINILLTKDILLVMNISKEAATSVAETLFLVFTSFYLVGIYKMIKIFTKNPMVLNTIISTFVIAFLIGSVVENPFLNIEVAGKKYYILTIHVCYSIGTILIIYHAILEIFQEEMSTIERLWGCACVYFMIAWAFGGIFDIVCIFDPQALGFTHQLNLASYLDSIAYSVSVLGNFNPLYANTSSLISRIAVIEAVWAHLFVVLVVGRLLAK